MTNDTSQGEEAREGTASSTIAPDDTTTTNNNNNIESVNENDPSNYLVDHGRRSGSRSSSPTNKTIVKVHDCTIHRLNGQCGMVERYNINRGRYDVRFIAGGVNSSSLLSLLVLSLFSITTLISGGPGGDETIALRPHNLQRATNDETKRHRLMQFLLKYHIVPFMIATIIMIVSISLYGLYDGTYYGALMILVFIVLLFILAPNNSDRIVVGDPRGGSGGGSNSPFDHQQRGRGYDTINRRRRSFGRSSPSPDRGDGGNSMNVMPDVNPYDFMKKVAMLIFGGIVIARIGMNVMNSEPSLSEKIYNLLGYAYTKGYDHNIVEGLPFIPLQEQYNQKLNDGENIDSTSLLVHFVPPQHDSTLEVTDTSGNPTNNKNKIPINELDIGEYTKMIEFWESLCHGLELFYELGYNDASVGEPRGSKNLYKQQQQLLIDSGLIRYL